MSCFVVRKPNSCLTAQKVKARRKSPRRARRSAVPAGSVTEAEPCPSAGWEGWDRAEHAALRKDAGVPNLPETGPAKPT